MKLPLAGRFCGDCHACCVLPSIAGLKGSYEPCSRLRDFGCNKYDKRPDPCRRFQCAYIGGAIDQRPSENGLLVQGSNDELSILEVWPGAWDAADRQSVLSTLISRTRTKKVSISRYKDLRPRAFSHTHAGADIYISGAASDCSTGGTAGGGFSFQCSSFDEES